MASVNYEIMIPCTIFYEAPKKNGRSQYFLKNNLHQFFQPTQEVELRCFFINKALSLLEVKNESFGNMKNQYLFYPIAIVLLLLLSTISCKKKNEPPIPEPVLISPATDITSTSFSCGAKFCDFVGSGIVDWGLCWSDREDPTYSGDPFLDDKCIPGGTNATITHSFTWLTPATTYYIRAYTVKKDGLKSLITYGNQITVTTSASIPTITTNNLTEITPTTAKGGGNITSDGGSRVVERGVCWSTDPNPTVDDMKTSDGSGQGSFSSSIYTVTRDAPVYIRAYATNSLGTAYGNLVSLYSGVVTVGKSFQGGMVAYILQPGDPGYDVAQTHGLIADPRGSLMACWTYGKREMVDTRTALGTGNYNTINIVKKLGEPGAAKYCYDLVLNGFSDWYLPSKDELNKLYLNRIAIGGFNRMGMNDYWSSSQDSPYYACMQNFNDGSKGGGDTFDGRYIRPVRSF